MRSLRKPLLAFALAGMAIAVPALAQQSSSAYPAACDASKVSKSDVDRAHTVFLSGKGFLDESNYDKAISYFRDAYSIDCSVHGILPIIATAYERKGDKASAVQALQEYIKRVPAASDREVVERRIRNLQDQMGAAAATSATPTVSATVSAPPSATAVPTGTVTAQPTQTATAPTSSATSTPPETGGHSAAPWIVVGIGGAAIVTGVILLVVGAGDVSTAQSLCNGGRSCPTSSDADQGNTGRTLETVGGIALGVGGAAVVGGLVWHFLEPTGPASPAAHLVPVVSPGYAGMSFHGNF
jgi:hypothetical protein